MLQGVFGDGGRSAEIAWLEGRGVEEVTAWIRHDHHASESVAAHAGLAVSDQTRRSDKHDQIERLWRRRLRPRRRPPSGPG
jgi:hypothetical protein